jgi:hypothetical protein
VLGLPAEAGAAVADTAFGLGELVRSVRAADVVAAVVDALPV